MNLNSQKVFLCPEKITRVIIFILKNLDSLIQKLTQLDSIRSKSMMSNQVSSSKMVFPNRPSLFIDV